MMRTLAAAILLSASPALRADEAKPAPDYASAVAPILKKYCVGCHNDGDREGDLSLETFASLKEGTPRGPALKPGDAAASRMVRMMTGQVKPIMPPKEETSRPG